MLFSVDMDQKLPASGATTTTNMHSDTAMGMEELFGVYGSVFFCSESAAPSAFDVSVKSMIQPFEYFKLVLILIFIMNDFLFPFPKLKNLGFL